MSNLAVKLKVGDIIRFTEDHIFYEQGFFKVARRDKKGAYHCYEIGDVSHKVSVFEEFECVEKVNYVKSPLWKVINE